MKALILADDDFELYSETRPAKRKPATMQSDPTRNSRMGLTDIRRGERVRSPSPIKDIPRPPCLENSGRSGAEPLTPTLYLRYTLG